MSVPPKKKIARQVTLKRQVAIKAIVTDKFKKYLMYEVEENESFAKTRVSEIEAALKMTKPQDATYYQLQNELQHQKGVLEQTPFQKKTVKELEIGSEYSQGLVDGFVAVSEGENIYEKLAGVEIIVKDAIVQTIKRVPLSNNPF